VRQLQVRLAILSTRDGWLSSAMVAGAAKVGDQSLVFREWLPPPCEEGDRSINFVFLETCGNRRGPSAPPANSTPIDEA